MTRAPILVLGVGNLLLSDEGVGIHVVRALENVELPATVDLLDGGTGGLQLLNCFRDYACILIVDAALDDQAPGTVSVRRPRFASDFPRVLSAHDLGLRDLLESALLLGPLPRMVLITVSIAAKQPLGTELSPTVRAAVGRVVDRVRTILRHETEPEMRNRPGGGHIEPPQIGNTQTGNTGAPLRYAPATRPPRTSGMRYS